MHPAVNSSGGVRSIGRVHYDVNQDAVRATLLSRILKVRASGALEPHARGLVRWAKVACAFTLAAAVIFSVNSLRDASKQPFAQQEQTLSSVLERVLNQRGVAHIPVESIFSSVGEKQAFLTAMTDIDAFRGLCPDSASSRDCARAVHDIDPFLSIVTLVEDLPKRAYFPKVGLDREKVNLPGGYSVSVRLEGRGYERVSAELQIAGFTQEQADLLIEGTNRRKIEQIVIPREVALALVRIVKDDYSQIASSRINANGHAGAFESLSRDQQAGLIYAAWNTGTVYKDAARTVRRLVSVQKAIDKNLMEGDESKARPLVERATSLIGEIQKQITPSFRVFNGRSSGALVKNHRLGDYVHAWLSGRSGEVVADARGFELAYVRARLEQESTRPRETSGKSPARKPSRQAALHVAQAPDSARMKFEARTAEDKPATQQSAAEEDVESDDHAPPPPRG